MAEHAGLGLIGTVNGVGEVGGKVDVVGWEGGGEGYEGEEGEEGGEDLQGFRAGCVVVWCGKQRVNKRGLKGGGGESTDLELHICGRAK